MRFSIWNKHVNNEMLTNLLRYHLEKSYEFSNAIWNLEGADSMQRCHLTSIGNTIVEKANLMTVLFPQWDILYSIFYTKYIDICILNQDPGPCITNVIATCRKNFSQWESSFLWKLRYHWLKFLRRIAKTLVIQGPGQQTLELNRILMEPTTCFFC